MKRIASILSLILFFPAFAPDARSATWSVDPSGGGDFTEIQAALDAAADGDTVLVSPGTYAISEPLDPNRLHDPDDPGSPPVKNVVLRSDRGPALTRIFGTARSPAGCVVEFLSGEDGRSTLEGFTLTGEAVRMDRGGGVRCHGSSPAIRGCIVTRCAGSGIILDGGASPAISDCTVSANFGSGLYIGVECAPRISDCTISGNYVEGAFIDVPGEGVLLERCAIIRNGYEGIVCEEYSAPVFDHCTVAGNLGIGFSGGYSCSPTVRSCIFHDNLGGSFEFAPESTAAVTFSSIEGASVWPGAGNILADPLFCGWGELQEAYVDPGSPAPGDGSKERPFQDLAPALDYGYGLADGSPCLGTGVNGTDMGAFPGGCGGPGVARRSVHVAAGTYDFRGLSLVHGATIFGAGAEKTVIEGTVFGARTGSAISGLTVTRGAFGGIRLEAGQSAMIARARVIGNEGGGIGCGEGASPTISDCEIAGNRSEFGGGGVAFCGGTPRLVGCVVRDNRAISGGGVHCSGGSALLDHCTIAGNIADIGGGIFLSGGAAAFGASCIVADNAGGSIVSYPNSGSSISMTYSCFEGPEVWPGEGNIDGDPRFCGSGPRPLIDVDASRPGPGDGSPESPYPDLASALAWSLALGPDTPCRGTGERGTDMGAETGTCHVAGERAPRIRLAPGTYDIEGLSLAHHISIEGAGAEGTAIHGAVFGLRDGMRLSGITVTGGTEGGIRLGAGEDGIITGCRITENRGTGGGAVRFNGASPVLTDCDVTGNCGLDGVVCESGSAPSLTRCTISGNDGSGAIVYRGASPSLEDCTIEENGRFGLLFAQESTGTVEGCTISRNLFGGLSCQSTTLALARCTISGNSSTWCGGVSCGSGATPILTACRIIGNLSKKQGGGVHCDNSSPTLIDCEISGNAGEEDGGVHCGYNSAPVLVNCNITGNRGRGIGCGSGFSSKPDLVNCIVFGNEDDAGCIVETTNCLVGVDPLFVREGAYDFARFADFEVCGQTVQAPDFVVVEPDERLLPGSPAIDGGTSGGAPATDIEGLVRPQGAGVDIGAHEFGGEAPEDRFRRGDADGSGAIDISDPIALLGHLFLGGASPGCRDAADADDSGALDLTDAIYSLSYQYLGAAAPPAPFPDCGLDPTADDLDCREQGACR